MASHSPKSWSFQPHCVLLFIGPSSSGKTTLAKYLFAECERQLGRETCMYIGSDQIREWLCKGCPTMTMFTGTTDKSSAPMMAASEGAFAILEAQYIAAMKYPVAKPVIIIDTTGLHEPFRNKMLELAREHHYAAYAVVFDLPISQLLAQQSSASTRTRKRIVSQHQRLRRDVLKSLGRFDNVYKIGKNFPITDNPCVIFANAKKACFLDPAIHWYIIGDVHACYIPMIQLLRKLPGVAFQGLDDDEFELTPNVGLVFAGDFVDKGPDLSHTLRWLHRHLHHPRIRLVRGNHEQRVFNAISAPRPETASAKKFPFRDHAAELLMDSELAAIFCEIYSETLPFVRCDGDSVAFIVTHAPCENRYLGKWDAVSTQRQQYYSYDRSVEGYQSIATFLQKQSAANYPYHVFGHIPVAEARVLDTNVCIDTGCGEGGRLTAIQFGDRGPKFFTVPAHLLVPASLVSSLPMVPLINIPYVRASGNEKDIDPLVLRRVKAMQTSGIQFISGTVSPVPADTLQRELESLREGIKFFRKKGAKKLVMQPKYMGSRCQVYLFPDVAKCYAVSRNGHLIQFSGYQDQFSSLCAKMMQRMANKDVPPFKMAIVDAELMPWSFLGQGLIAQFDRYGAAATLHLQKMEQHGFDQVLQSAVAWADALDQKYHVLKEPRETVEKALVASGESRSSASRLYSKFRHLQKLRKIHIPLEKQRKNFVEYAYQMNLYGKPVLTAEDLQIKPFDVLKLILLDGTEQVMPYDPEKAFRILSDDKICLLDLANETDDVLMDHAYPFFGFVSGYLQLEGVVLKDLNRTDIPFLKVRNPDYLRIIYNPNYLENLDTFIESKNIRRKLRLSEMEWRVGRQMLERRYDTLATDTAFERMAVQFLQEEDLSAKKVDARL